MPRFHRRPPRAHRTRSTLLTALLCLVVCALAVSSCSDSPQRGPRLGQARLAAEIDDDSPLPAEYIPPSCPAFDPASPPPLPPVSSTTEPAGTIQGAFSVSRTGEAQYTIPIVVPPGRAGMEPTLAVAYDSAEGESTLGMGFSLKGLSAVTRCARNVAQDGEVRGVQYDEGDALCLDGRRLVPVATSATVDEYRTLPDTFTKVLAHYEHWERRKGPKYLEAFTRSGRIVEYGREASGQVLARDGVIRAWWVTRERDRSGNAIDTSYRNETDPAKGYTVEHAPLRIDYTSFPTPAPLPSLPASRAVVFDYYDKQPGRTLFSRGMMLRRSWRLDHIKTFGPGEALVRDYRFHYGTGPATGRRLLDRIEECAADGVCKPPTRFGWRHGSGPGFTEIATGVPVPGSDLGTAMAMDVTGDGLDDIVLSDVDFVGDGELPITSWVVAPNVLSRTPTSFGELLLGAEQHHGEATLPMQPDVGTPIDYNHDGRMDLFLHDVQDDYTTWVVLLAQPDHTFISEDTGIAHPRGIGPTEAVRLHTRSNGAHLADVDGDGMSDLIQCVANGVDFTWTANLWRPEGPGFTPNALQIPTLHWHPCNAELHTTDLDGDGKVELLVFATAIATGGGATFSTEYEAVSFEAPGTWTSRRTGLELFPTDGRVMFLDVNGDGLPDAVEAGFPDNRFRTFINTGDGFSAARDSLDSSLPTLGAEFLDKVAAPIDFNSDGRQDLLVPMRLPGTSPQWVVLQATGEVGDGTFTLVIPPIPMSTRMQDSGATLAHPWAPRPADLNGDGAQDLVIAVGTEMRAFLNQLPDEDLLSTIADGLNPLDPDDAAFAPNVRIEYAHLTDLDATEAPSTTPREARTYLPRYNERDDCAYPNRCAVGSRRVVSGYWIGDGDLVQRPFAVTYRNGRYNRLGGGFVGFGERIIHDLYREAGTIERYDNVTFVPSLGVFPFAGEVVEELRWSVASLSDDPTGAIEIVHKTTLPTVAKTNGGATYYTVPILRREVRAEGEVSAALGETLEEYVRDTPTSDLVVLSETLKTIGDFDEYGNMLDEAVSTEGIDYKHRVIRRFDNDPDTWLIGQMRHQSECSSASTQEQCRTTDRTYNERGLLRYERSWTSDNDPETKLAIRFEHDIFGNVVETIAQDAFGAPRAACVSYDSEGIFPYAHVNAAGHVSRMRFDPGLGVQTQRVDPNGLLTYWRHDKLGRVWFERRPDGVVTVSSIRRTKDGGPHHDRWNIKVDRGTAGGQHETVEYDGLGRAVRWWAEGVQTGATAPDRIMQWVEFDRLGERVARRSIPMAEHAPLSPNQYDEYAYDKMGRLVSHKTPWHAETTYAYRGRRVRIEGPAATTDIVNDPLGRPVTITNAGIATTTYAYGPFGGLWKVTDPGGAETVTERDAYGRVRSRVDPDRGATEIHTSGYGETRYSIDALGRRIEYERDALGRLTARHDADGTTQWIWDKADHGVGKLSEVDSPAGHKRTYAYDDGGRLETSALSIDGEDFTTGLQYDEFGRVRRIAYPHGDGVADFAVRHGYDPHGHLIQVTDDTSGLPCWQETAADGVGRIHTERFGDGADTERLYYGDKDRVRSIETNQSGRTLQRLSYDYDDRLNLTSRADGLQGKTEYFAYDALDRLTEASFDATPGPFTFGMAYAPNGNIEFKPGVGVYTYDPEHPHAVQTAGSSWYGYDAVGNQRTRPGATIDYTAFDKPKVFTLNGGPETVALDYDGNQERVRKTTPDETTVYVDGLYERVTSARTGEVEHRYYVRSPERVVAVVTRKAGVPEKQAYLHVDHLGSVDVVDDGSPAVERRSYDAFGARRDPSWGGSAPPAAQSRTTRGFTGHEGDGELGLVNMNGRMYDPVLGRFLTPDPVVAKPLFGQSWNAYSYVLNNPLAYVDPSGLSEDDSGLGKGWPDGTYDFVDANGTFGSLIVVTPDGGRSDRDDDRSGGAEAGAYVAPVDVNVYGTGSGDAPEPTVSATEQGSRRSAGDIGLGVADGVGHFAGGVGTALALNALTFGVYGSYETARAAWNGYQEDGLVGAINAVNPLFQLAKGGADAYMAADQGDYRAAAAAATPVALAAVGAVLGGALGREALAAEEVEGAAAAQAAREAVALPRSVGAAAHSVYARLEAAVARNGGKLVEGGASFATRRAARQAASEIAGDLGPGARAIRASEFRGGPWTWQDSNRVIGREAADGSAFWRDDMLGHPQFGMGPHVNTGVNGIEFHLFY